MNLKEVAFGLRHILGRANIRPEDVEITLTFKTPQALAMFKQDMRLTTPTWEMPQGEPFPSGHADFCGIAFRFEQGWRTAVVGNPLTHNPLTEPKFRILPGFTRCASK